jgi:ABC-type glutathione transport system ATPase component
MEFLILPRMLALTLRSAHGRTATMPLIAVKDLTVAYGSFVIQRDLTFSIQLGEIFIIMGRSGCGKSTLLRCLIGLLRPATGEVFYDGERCWAASAAERAYDAAVWRPLPERRAVEFDDVGRERGLPWSRIGRCVRASCARPCR